MAERSTEREPSISSSTTEAETFNESEKTTTNGSSEGAFANLKSPEELDIGDEDVERAGLLPPAEHEKPQPAPDHSTRTAAIWMIVNTLATIGIVSPPNVHIC